eukprot:SAG31_NODE_42411_length_271_cov_3.529070_1_plen_60_part_10
MVVTVAVTVSNVVMVVVVAVTVAVITSDAFLSYWLNVNVIRVIEIVTITLKLGRHMLCVH